MSTNSQSILLIESNVFNQIPLSPIGRHIGSFVSERGQRFLNLQIEKNLPPSRLFEDLLHLVKQTDLAILLFESESTLAGVILTQLINKGRRVLLFSQNQAYLNELSGLTLKPLYLYHYSTAEEIINTLKLFKV